MEDQAAFRSFHIEASGSDPSYDANAKKVESETYTLKADSAGKDLYLVYTSAKGGAAAQTTEGYAINGGIGGDNGKEYVVESGKLKESLGAISMTWVFFPLRVVFPLSVASMGPSAQGSETIDGRQADKYGVDTANAPAGAMGALSAFLSVTSAKGTVWLDKETGALLKCVIDYDQNLTDAPGSKTVVASGKGHLELLVTKVNNTTVKLPQ